MEHESRQNENEIESFEYIAFRLLQLQQRLDAWDRLYNEEIGGLQRDVAALNAAYVRLRQAHEHAGATSMFP